MSASPSTALVSIPANETPPVCDKKTCVLIVEDNELNRDLLQRRLIKAGFAVEIAVDGAECVAKASSPDIEMILMDMSLPRIDGWEATQIIRSWPSTVPIIALTAHAMAQDRERSLAVGCNAFVTKPIDFHHLLTEIETVLDESSAPIPQTPVPPTAKASVPEAGFSAMLRACAHDIRNHLVLPMTLLNLGVPLDSGDLDQIRKGLDRINAATDQWERLASRKASALTAVPVREFLDELQSAASVPIESDSPAEKWVFLDLQLWPFYKSLFAARFPMRGKTTLRFLEREQFGLTSMELVVSTNRQSDAGVLALAPLSSLWKQTVGGGNVEESETGSILRARIHSSPKDTP